MIETVFDSSVVTRFGSVTVRGFVPEPWWVLCESCGRCFLRPEWRSHAASHAK